ncbi:MAG: LemA family protein [Planctomycetota bacterium]|nr:LemA family protein [Planctomycetota bacterium]
MLAATTQPGLAAGALTAGLLLGWLFAALLRRQDLKTFLFARAPLLPIRSLSAHDDAWLRGIVQSERPLRCPWFDVPCVAYGYDIEEEKTESYTDSEGKTQTRTTWTNVHSSAEACAFTLDDGERLVVALPEGTCEARSSLGTSYEHSDRRHTAWALELGATVSAFGVLRDDGSFGPLRNVPLVVTFASRADRVRSSASAEGWLFFFAVFCWFAGVTGAAGILMRAEEWPSWLLAAGAGILAATPQWALLTYNRLVRLRQQVTTAEKQISIELAQRADLVPNLVAVITAASEHERELVEGLTALRSHRTLEQQVREEEEARGAARDVLLLHERYPKLTSDALYRDLHDRLWTTEEKIAHARGFYNDTITEWNDRVQKVPSNLVAVLARMSTRVLFCADEDVELPVRLTSEGLQTEPPAGSAG